MKIKYIHLRKLDSNGKPLTKGGATIAYTVSTPSIDGITKVEYDVAYCSDNDNFSKKIGRNVSGGRLGVGLHSDVFLYFTNNNTEVVKELVSRVDGTF